MSDSSHLSDLLISREAASHAYAPDSHFRVGAALFTQNGQSFCGANCETAFYEGEICGERNAIFNAITSGALKNGTSFIKSIAVSCLDAPANASLKDGMPCGTCRQVINEFGDKTTSIIVDDGRDGQIFTLSALLPQAFRFAPSALPESDQILSQKEVADIEGSVRIGSLDELVAARQIAVNSYAPYSGCRTGAIIRTLNGNVYAGVRVENSSTGLTADPLRVAIGRAIMNEKEPLWIMDIAIAQIDAGRQGRTIAPERLINTELLHEFAAINPTTVNIDVYHPAQGIKSFYWRNRQLKSMPAL